MSVEKYELKKLKKKQKEELNELKKELKYLEKIVKLKNNTSKFITDFKHELKKSIVTAITAALGFLIAIAWKDVVVNLVNNTIVKFGVKKSSIASQTYSALIITIICVIGIMLVSSWANKQK
jgi:citrate lyase alpha subunit